MQAAKLKLPPGKYENYIATSNRYNASVKPIQHKAYDDPYSVEWVEDWNPETLFPNDVSDGISPARCLALTK
jgi:hypothetical protein